MFSDFRLKADKMKNELLLSLPFDLLQLQLNIQFKNLFLKIIRHHMGLS